MGNTILTRGNTFQRKLTQDLLAGTTQTCQQPEGHHGSVGRAVVCNPQGSPDSWPHIEMSLDKTLNPEPLAP